MRKFILLALCYTFLFAVRVDLCIDPGHGGSDPGYVNESHGASGPFEKNFNLEIGLLTEMYAPEWNVTVSMTRRTDEFVYLTKRKKIGEGKTPSAYNTFDTCIAFVSIHCNGVDDSTVSGTETWYWPRTASLSLADKVQYWVYNYICNLPYANNRGLNDSTFTVLTSWFYSACLLEAAFMSHDISSTAQWFQLLENQNGFKDKVAWGILDGVYAFITVDRPILRMIGQASERSAIGLSWSPCPSSVVAYNVYRQTYPSTEFVQIASSVIDTLYTDNSVYAGSTYAYCVKGVLGGGQESVRSNIVAGQISPFSSNTPTATALNNSRKIIFDGNGVLRLFWKNMGCVWNTSSTDNGSSWAVAQRIEVGNELGIDKDSNDSIKIVWAEPETEPEYTNEGTMCTGWRENNTWNDAILFHAVDSIMSCSFAIDPLDTGWVVFNTYDDQGNNTLKIGQFYTQATPDSLENVTNLDTYTSIGIGALAVVPSDTSIVVVYERNGNIYCKFRLNNGNWYTKAVQTEGIHPSLSVSQAGDLVHLIWEKYYPMTNNREIQTATTEGLSRVQTIASVKGENCYPYIEKGSIAVWSDLTYPNQWDIYMSRRTESGTWSTPVNISQSSTSSKYPQVALHQTISQAKLIYTWTEGSQPPYEVKVKPDSLISDFVPLYAFDLGEEEACFFSKSRDGRVKYGDGYEKTADYGNDCLHYRITGLEPDKIYRLRLVSYQCETDALWQQAVDTDNKLVELVDLDCDDVVATDIMLPQEHYTDGMVDVKIRRVTGPKAVLSAMSVWEYDKDDRITISSAPRNSSSGPGGSICFGGIYPNPGKDDTKIKLIAPYECNVSVILYDVSGRLVNALHDGKIAGSYEIPLARKELATGVYFVRIVAEGETITEKVILLK